MSQTIHTLTKNNYASFRWITFQSISLKNFNNFFMHLNQFSNIEISEASSIQDSKP